MQRPGKLRGEPLEPRQLLAIVGVPWQDPRHLTFSFAPDGTPIAGHTSSLYETLGQAASPDEWQAEIARALQTWAVAANLDFGFRDDSAHPLGVAGKLQGDARFGDLRFAAQAMHPSSLAIAVLHDPFLSGTLAGDVLFNSNVAFGGPQTDLFGIALHEVGHALGLDDNNDPTSVMFEHAGNALTTLGPGDVVAIQALYGQRAPDAHDLIHANDLLSTATPIRFPQAAGHAPYAGSTPLVVYGDLRNDADLDHYELPSLGGYTGPVTLRLQSEGLSLLAPRLEVFDASGTRLAEGQATDALGGVVTLTLPSVGPGQSLFLRVSGARSDVFGVGRYGLAVTYEDREGAAFYVLDQLLIGPYDSLTPEEIQQLFENPHGGYVGEESYGNETLATATVLTTTLGYQPRTHYEALGSVSMATDIDFYRVEAPTTTSARVVLTATVADMPLNGAQVTIELLDSQGQTLESEVLANGNGMFTVQAQSLAPGGVYYLKVTGINPTPTTPGSVVELGNYTLAASFGTRAAEIETFVAGQLRRPVTSQTVMLYVAEDQLFHFLLHAQPAAGSTTGSSAVEMRLYDEQGQRLLTMTSREGESVSAPAQHIFPGTYRLEFRNLLRASGQPVEFTLRGGRLTKPIGPAIEDPTLEPLFEEEGDPTVFRYPGGIVSPDPVLFVVLPALPLLPGLGPAGGAANATPASRDSAPVLAPHPSPAARREVLAVVAAPPAKRSLSTWADSEFWRESD